MRMNMSNFIVNFIIFLIPEIHKTAPAMMLLASSVHILIIHLA